MPGAREPSPAAETPLKEVGLALSKANDAWDLEKRVAARETNQVGPVLFYCGLNALLSAALISFNKHLMHKDRFPYPVPLVAMHTTASSVFVALFFLAQRSSSSEKRFFSALPQALADTSIKTKIFVLAALFGVQLVFSNAAYIYSSIVFIQMMKEGNLPFVYALSALLSLEVVHWQRIRVLLFIVGATLLTIQGALDFTWMGFLIQLTGQTFEGSRLVLQALLLNARGLNLDVLTYMLLVMPACSMLLGNFMAINSYTSEATAVALPTWRAIHAWWPQLLANAGLAVALNFATAFAVKHASAVGLVLSGIVKDSAIVLCGAYFLGESITGMQVVGFTMQISGILLYSMIKLHPDKFQDGISEGVKRMLGMEVEAGHGLNGEKCRHGAVEDCSYGTADLGQ